MKFKDIENKSVEELNELLNDLRAESFTLGWKNKTQQQDQTHKIKLVRRDIARVLTALKQKEIASGTSNKTKSTQSPKKPAAKKAAPKKSSSTKTKETKIEEGAK